MIDKSWIGHEAGRSTLTIERGRLKFFAKAIGEINPIYSDVRAARNAGYADIPAPPTFLFAAEFDSGAMFALFDQLEVPLPKILHGEEGLEYFSPVIAGDTITVSTRVKDIYQKREGALEFIETESIITNQNGVAVAQIRNIAVIRN